MNEGLFKQFAMRPYWQQHFLFIGFALISLMIAYFIFLLPMQKTLSLQQKISHEKQQGISQLNETLIGFPDKDELYREIALVEQSIMTTVIKDIQEAILTLVKLSGLEVKQVQRYDESENRRWQVSLSGYYQQFIDFLHSFYLMMTNWQIQQIEIKKEAEQMIFSLVFLT